MRVCARAPTSSGARSPHPDARWTRASPPGRCQHDSAEVVVVPAVEDIDVLVAAARVDSVMMEQRRQVRTSAHSIPAQACSSNARSHLETPPQAGAPVTLPHYIYIPVGVQFVPCASRYLRGSRVRVSRRSVRTIPVLGYGPLCCTPTHGLTYVLYL